MVECLYNLWLLSRIALPSFERCTAVDAHFGRFIELGLHVCMLIQVVSGRPLGLDHVVVGFVQSIYMYGALIVYDSNQKR